MKDDRFRPDAAARRVMAPDPGRMSGKRADRVIVDDPHEESIPESDIAAARAKASSLFENLKPLASVGRNSIPKSHRGEGLNYVD